MLGGRESSGDIRKKWPALEGEASVYEAPLHTQLNDAKLCLVAGNPRVTFTKKWPALEDSNL